MILWNLLTFKGTDHYYYFNYCAAISANYDAGVLHCIYSDPSDQRLTDS